MNKPKDEQSRRIAHKQLPLTAGQAEILELANQGLSIHSIAIKSQLTVSAVRKVLVCCSNKGHPPSFLIEGRV